MTWITAPKRLPRPKESDVQRAILAALAVKGYMVLAHLPNRKSTKKQAMLPGMLREIERAREEAIRQQIRRALQLGRTKQIRGVVWRSPAGKFKWAYRSKKGEDSGGVINSGFPGLADLSGIRFNPMPARPLFIEVKAPGGTASAGQPEFREFIRAMGGIAMQVDDPEQIIKSEEL